MCHGELGRSARRWLRNSSAWALSIDWVEMTLRAAGGLAGQLWVARASECSERDAPGGDERSRAGGRLAEGLLCEGRRRTGEEVEVSTPRRGWPLG